MPNSTRQTPRCNNGKTYGQGCKCAFCRKQIAAQNALYRHKKDQRDRGVQFDDDLIDATPTREILLEAQQQGLTDRDLELLTGVRRESFTRIRMKKSLRIRRRTALSISKALEHMDIAERHPMTLVDSKWVRQMSLSLCAQGWSRQHQRDILKNNLGEPGGFITSRPRYARSEQMYYKNLQHMKWLVRAIGEKQGPATALAKRMQTRGIFPTKHYSIHGDLIESSLTREQRLLLERV